MFKACFQTYLNQSILKESSKLNYVVADFAPSNEIDLFSRSKSQGLIIWSGASEATVFQDKSVNWAFRALHDTFHLKSGLGFSPSDEILIGKLQAKSIECPYLRQIIEIEVSEQAAYYLSNGVFVSDQISFMKSKLINNNLFKGLVA